MPLKANSKHDNLPLFPNRTIKTIQQLRLNRRKNRKTRNTKQTKQNGTISVYLSFCCISVDPISFSLEQNMRVVLRQAFILY